MSTSDFAYLSPASDARWQSITAGSLHTCGVRTDGSAWCWGFNQLDFPGWPIPHQIGIDSDWVSISARDSVDCGLRISGSGWCWGSNGYGQLGIGTFSSPTRRPEEVRGTADWITLEPGSEHTCGLRTDHSIWCWGHSKFGQLGNGSSGINTFVTVPRQIGSTSDWISLSTGHSHTCGIRADGSAWCWGLNDKGQLGNGTITNATIPQQVQGGSDWISISAGAVSTCGLRLDGSAWCWGGNHYGQLGNGTTTDAAVPQPVKGRSGWRSISAGGASNCGLRTDGSAWCWGGNYYGQLGNGTTVDAAIPQRVGDHSDWISLSAGNLIHACGLRSDGSAWCWGDNSSGQLGNNSTLASSVPVPVANP
jgi:alpha-tubulin suppressor-like RCC1 family protein